MTFCLDFYKSDAPLPTSWYGITASDIGYEFWLESLRARAYKAYICTLLTEVDK